MGAAGEKAIALMRCSTLVLALVLVTRASTAGVAAETELAAKGRAIALERCGHCHATGTDDRSTHEKAPPFRLVVERYPSEHLAEALAEGIVTGHKDMPIFVFDPPAIEAFLAYLDSLPPSSKPESGK